MKNSMMMALGVAAGMSLYAGMQKAMKNKNKIKKSVDDLIDNTSNMF